jgi:hypothetical protein
MFEFWVKIWLSHPKRLTHRLAMVNGQVWKTNPGISAVNFCLAVSVRFPLHTSKQIQGGSELLTPKQMSKNPRILWALATALATVARWPIFEPVDCDQVFHGVLDLDSRAPETWRIHH